MGNLAKDSVKNEKKVLRQRMHLRRAALDGAQALRCSAAAQRALMADSAWADARQLTLYVAARGEVDTSLLLEAAWREGKDVLLPRCRSGQEGPRGGAGLMDFVRCTSMADMAPGHFGLLEPRQNMPAVPWDCERGILHPDLVVIPGVAFDAVGNRLGYGGGYYDRALCHPALAGAAFVGLAYAWQVVERLPVERWDSPMHGLCTEEGLRWL